MYSFIFARYLFVVYQLSNLALRYRNSSGSNHSSITNSSPPFTPITKSNIMENTSIALDKRRSSVRITIGCYMLFQIFTIFKQVKQKQIYD